jgi:hypothetical protein
VRAPIFVRLARRGRAQHVPRPGLLKNVTIKEIQARGARIASSITSVTGAYAEKITLQNIKVAVREGGAGSVTLRVPEFATRYPDATMFRDLPAYGLYCRHVAGLRVEDVDFSIDEPDARSAVVLDNVKDARLRAIRAMAPFEGRPLVWLNAVRDAELRELDPRGGRIVARLSGALTARIRVARRDAEQGIVVDPDVGAAALQTESGRVATSGNVPV